MIYDTDLVDIDRMKITFRDEMPDIDVEKYKINKWRSRLPYSHAVRVIQYHQQHEHMYHLGKVPDLHASQMIGKLDAMIDKYQYRGLDNKDACLIFKHKTVRE